MEKVISYIDGFNLYFGLKDSGWQKYYWLDVQRMSKALLKSTQSLVCTKYFTAQIIVPPDKKKRQNTYLEALGILSDFKIFYGRYQMNEFKCPNCNVEFKVPNEKKTDVNIATELIFDAFNDNFDMAMIISADSDLAPPILRIKEHFPEKRMLIVFPPNRFSFELTSIGVPIMKTIRRTVLKNSQFPDEIIASSGYTMRRPSQWG